jgi:hypothetical protein
MTEHEIANRAASLEQRQSWLAPTRRVASPIGAALGLVFLPKCPLCIAAYLVSFGIGAGAAHAAAPFIRPAAWLLMGVATWR